MKQMKTIFKCILKVASPIHLGCDEVYEPTCFTVDETNQRLTVFDPLAFIASLPEEERDRFSDICKRGMVQSILEVYKFLHQKTAEGRSLSLCNGFVDHYKKILALDANEKTLLQNLNQFQVARTAFRPVDERPYIPGSAIKGALRTAYLNQISKIRRVPTPRCKNPGKDLEKSLLEYNPGQTETDPFRLVKVSDFQPVGAVETRIVYAVNKKKKVSDKEARGPYQILEVVEPGAVFAGDISVEQPVKAGVIRNPIDFDFLIKSIGEFYMRENGREIDELNNIGITGVSVERHENKLPFRLGRHSGAESLTVEGHRDIKIMLGKRGGKSDFTSKGGATTVWLSSETDKNLYNKGLRPFGWVQLEKWRPEIQTELDLAEKDFKTEREKEQKHRIAEADQRRKEEERLLLEAENRQRELEKKAQEEAAKQAALDAMTPEEREILELKDPVVAEEKINIAFKKLDDYAPENQRAAAEIIKNYWQAQKRWTKKDFSTKQWKTAREKIAKIKSILGEE